MTNVLPILVLCLLIASLPAWLLLRDKSTEVRSSLIHQYAEILRQLDQIICLREEFNRVCAEQSLNAKFDDADLKRFVSLTRNALSEIEGSSALRTLFKLPKYWYHAEIYAKYIAPSEGQLQDAIENIKRTAAP